MLRDSVNEMKTCLCVNIGPEHLIEKSGLICEGGIIESLLCGKYFTVLAIKPANLKGQCHEKFFVYS